MIGFEQAYKIGEKVLWLIEEYIAIAAIPKSYGTDMQFHRLDIHLIHSIGMNPGINVTELAKKHAITKSAVSQAVKKLEKRSLIERYQSPENRKEILFRLTESGRKGFEAHREYHATSETKYIEELAKLTEEEAAGVNKFLDVMQRRADNIKKENS
jgi:DNA-binding MarR family transcriptional regulator